MSPLPRQDGESSESNPDTISSNKEQIFTKFSIIKNLVIVAVGTFLLIGSEDILLMYQSTMNSDDSIGVTSIAVQYAFAVLSSLFLPKYLIMRFGCKAVMVLSIVTYAPFYLANYHPMQFLMILTSALLGAGCSLFKGSIDLYINDLASIYAKLKDCSTDLIPDEGGTQIADHKQLSSQRTIEELQIDKKPVEVIKINVNQISLPSNKTIDYSNNDIKKSEAADEFEFEKKQMKTVRASELKYHYPNQSSTDLTATKNLYNSLDINNEKTHNIEPISINYNISNSEVLNTNPIDKNIINFTSANPNKTDIKSSTELYTIKFFGFHSMIYQTCYIWSNLVSFFILQTGYSNNQTPDVLNSTCLCGATYCNEDDDMCLEQNLQQPTPDTRIILLSMCVALCLLGAIFVIVFLDSLRQRDRSVKISLKMLLATLHQMKRKEQIFLVPLTMNNGMMKGFFLADFTKSYIGCAWGIKQIGLVAAFSGGAMAFFSLMSGWFVKCLGRRFVFTTAGVLNFALNLIFLLWSPDSSQPAMFFVAAALWGGLFGTFHTQVRAFYGVLFKNDEEAAFGAYQLWYCIGSCLCLAFSNILCNNIKIYILMGFTLMGTIGYWMIELCNFQVANSTTHIK